MHNISVCISGIYKVCQYYSHSLVKEFQCGGDCQITLESIWSLLKNHVVCTPVESKVLSGEEHNVDKGKRAT